MAQVSPATLPDLRLSRAGNVIAVAVQNDGKVIIGGSFSSVNNVPRTNIARLNPNGSVDLTWNASLSEFSIVYSIVAAETHIYVGGSLDVLDDPGRSGLFRSSAANGSTDKNWGPKQSNLTVRTIVLNGDEVYVAGSFTSFGGLVRSNVAKLRATGSGAIDTSWNPSANGPVRKLVVNGTNIFVAGDFTSIGSQNRTNLAKLSAGGTGAADPVWDAKVKVVDPGYDWGLAVSGTNIYIRGTYTNIGGMTRPGLAKLSALGTGTVDANWNPPAQSPLFILNSSSRLALINNALFYGAANTAIKLDANGNGARDTNWNATFDGGPHSFYSTPSGLFVAGPFRICNGAVSLALAKLDLVSGARDQGFVPQVERAPGTVRAIVQQPDGKKIIGGDFWSVGGLPRQNLARINQDGTVDRFWSPDANGTVYALAISGTNIFVGGQFTTIGGLNRTSLAKLAIQGSDSVDTNWDARMTFGGPTIYSLVIGDTNLFVGGSFQTIGGQSRQSLAKLSTLGPGNADPSWQADVSPGIVNALALSGTNLFVGGFFTSVKGVARKYLAKLSAVGSGAVDTNWNASVVTGNNFREDVFALAVVGTNLFVGGGFTNIGGLSRKGLAKVRTAGTGVVDPNWNPLLDASGRPTVYALSLDASTNIYAGGFFFHGVSSVDYQYLVRVGTSGAGSVDASFNPIPDNGCTALLVTERGVHAGGQFTRIGGANRSGFAFLAIANAPQLIQDSPANLFILPNAVNGPEVTHFRITGVSGGALYRADGVTRVNTGDFLTVADGDAGLRFVSGGTVTAVAALNDTTNGAGTAASTLVMSTNPGPVFKFSAATYSVREGQDNIVVIVRKFGAGAATMNYATSDLTATGNLDYQTRSGTLSFSAADKFKNIIIAIANDLQMEGDEQFSITLTNASAGASIAAPATTIVTLVDNDLAGVSDSLTTTVSPPPPPLSTGVLIVSLQPANANGQWRLSGELNWHDSDAMISGLVFGNYAIEFRPVNGYFQPQTVTVPISADTTNHFTFLYAATTDLDTGNLSVIIQPSEVATNANTSLRGQWRRQGGPTNWLSSGDLVANLNAGSYTVEFKPVAGRATPLPQLIEVGGANAIYSGVGTYFFASAPGAETPAVVPFGLATTNEPYFHNGQIQSSVGFGSGFVVKRRVVLTAAHVLFDDLQLSYVTTVLWFSQRYRDKLEPVPQVPRGWYVFDGYAAQRQLDNSPGISTPASQNLDAAAMYFLEDAGRGGYGGYLSSDADNNEYLLSANDKFVAGYPLEGIDDADKGKLFATAPLNLNFVHLYTGIFSTTNIASFPGNSGGPLYVQADVGKYFPAAIYLGGSGETLVRAINSEVVDLINRAEISGNGGGNSTGGGAIVVNPGQTAAPIGTGLLTVGLAPSNAINARPGWRIAGLTDTNYFTNALTTVAVIGGGGYPIEFKPIPGFITPSNVTVAVAVGGLVTIRADYVGIRPQLALNPTSGLTLAGSTSATYRVEFKTNLVTQTNWTALTSFTLASPSLPLSNTRPATNGNRFYRAVLVP